MVFYINHAAGNKSVHTLQIEILCFLVDQNFSSQTLYVATDCKLQNLLDVLSIYKVAVGASIMARTL